MAVTKEMSKTVDNSEEESGVIGHGALVLEMEGTSMSISEVVGEGSGSGA